MGYMDNVPLADELAGGARTDLDDVTIADPVTITHGVYRVPEELPLLDYLESQVRMHDLVSVMDKFFEWPEGVDRYDAMQELLFNLQVRDDDESTYTTRGLSISQVRKMYCKYGAAVWQQNPHLTKKAVYDHLVTLGYDGTTWAFYQYLHRNGGEAAANTERTRLARGKRV
jgi:hypothetical protein